MLKKRKPTTSSAKQSELNHILLQTGFRQFHLELSPSTSKALRKFAEQESTKDSMVCQSLLAILMHRFWSEEEISVGEVLHTDKVPFVTRSQINPNLSYLAYLRSLAKSEKEIRSQFDSNQDGGLTFFYELVPASSNIAIGLYLRSDSVGAPSQEDLQTSLEWLTENYLSKPQGKLLDVPLLPSLVSQKILAHWSGSNQKFETCHGVHELFERQVDRTPSALAIEFKGEKLTYQQLDQRANQLAHYLRAQGIGANQFVGLCMERSIELYVAIYAVLKAGGAYVPLDPEYPRERLHLIVEDIRCSMILTQSHLASLLPAGAKALSMDQDWQAQISSQRKERPSNTVHPENLAYMIYTSGSTGLPKGCATSHFAIANYIQWSQAHYPMTADDKLYHKTPFTFDSSVPELLWPLMAGASVVIAPPGAHRDSASMVREMREKQVTYVDFTPSMLQLVLEEEEIQTCKSIRVVTVGGEALAKQTLKKFFEQLPKARLGNLYGPTEAAVTSTYWDCSPKDVELASVPIGYPLPNTKCYILESQTHSLVPAGVWGDLYLGGVQVARGYWNRPELTSDRFIEDPFAKTPGTRMYKTGDRARFLENGAIEFQGRSDLQVKVRGFRVELGEIEVAMLTHPKVVQAAVVLKKIHGEQGPASLVAYWVGKSEVHSEEIREILKTSLPEYMMPSAFVRLDSMPQMTSGKIDRKALNARHDDIQSEKKSYVAPIDEMERNLASAWEKVLNIKPIGRDDNYFSLGGDSLGLIRILHALKTHQYGLELKDLYDHQTIAGLGNHLRDSKKSSKKSAPSLAALNKVNRSKDLPASTFQERLYFVQKVNPHNTGSNTVSILEISRALDIEKFQASLKTVLQRNEILRTHFKQIQDRVFQVVTPSTEIHSPLHMTDFSSLQGAGQEQAVQSLIQEFSKKPFDLDRGPLYRFHLLKLKKDQFHFFYVIHHSIYDGDSDLIFRQDMTETYASLTDGRPAPNPAGGFQYADYAAWEKQNISEEYLKSQKEYWSQKLSNPPELLNLPLDFARPATIGANFKTESVHLSKNLWQSIRSLSRQEKVTPSIVGMAASFALLHRYSGDEDICMGTPINRRVAPELQNMMGPILNSIVLRSQFQSEQSFQKYLSQIAGTCQEAYLNADVSLDQIFKIAKPSRNMSYAPLYQVSFTFTDSKMDQATRNHAVLPLKEIGGDVGAHNMDIVIQLHETEQESATLTFRYNSDLFRPESIQRMLRSFEALLSAVAQNPNQRVDQLNILSPADRTEVLEKLSGTSHDFESCNGVHELFERQVDRTPNALALEYGDEKITYRELDEKANQLAHYLRNQGVTKDVLVGLCMERSIELYVAIYAVFKAGGAYVPLDPEHPQDRLSILIDEIQSPVLITQARLKDRLPEMAHQRKVLCIDSDWKKEIAVQKATRPENRTKPDHLAYIFYTSGSTGKPKGCANTHQGIANYILWLRHQYPMKASDKLLQKTPFTFDVSLPEVLSPLMQGASVAIAKPGGHKDAAYMVREILNRGVTHIRLVPSMLQVLLEEPGVEKSKLRYASAGGETLPPATLKRFFELFPKAELVNSYGPTEAAVVSTYWNCTAPDSKLASIPIGYALPNTKTYILDPNSKALLPAGVWGELYLGGVQLAREYWKRPDLTEASFVADPFSSKPGARLYKTGDRARFLPNGAIEFQGRFDFQVKVRGFRIELGEIEMALLSHPSVLHAAVVVKKINADQGPGHLVAYWVAKSEAKPEELKEHLKKSLPEYMIPSFLVSVEALPQTSSGKVDRKALVARKDQFQSENKNYVPPADEIEKKLVAAWETVLKIKPISRDDNYFSLGGDSLGLIRMLHALRDHQFGLELKDLYAHQSVAELGDLIRGRSSSTRGEKVNSHFSPLVRIPRDQNLEASSFQKRLYFLQKLNPENTGSNTFSLKEISSSLDVSAFEKSLKLMVERHDILRTRFNQIDDKVVQIIDPSSDASTVLIQIDLSHLKGETQKAALRAAVVKCAKDPFDLDQGPLYRFCLLKTGSDRFSFLKVMHHIIMDGDSSEIFFDELNEIYASLVQKKAVHQTAPEIQYADYAAWEKKNITEEYLKNQKQYWSQKLANPPELLNLPLDFTRPAVLGANFKSETLTLSKDLWNQIRQASREQKVTPSILGMAACFVFLHRYSGDEDVCVGTPISRRVLPEMHRLMGPVLNSIVMRSQYVGTAQIKDYVAQFAQISREAYLNADVSLDQIFKLANPTRNLSYAPLYQVVFDLFEMQTNAEKSGAAVLKFKDVQGDMGAQDMDLAIRITEEPTGEATLLFRYNSDLFRAESVQRMQRSFETLLAQFTSKPDLTLAELTLLSKADAEAQLRKYSGVEQKFEPASGVHEFFERQVDRNPNAIALECNDQKITYGELDQRANQLAHYLRAHGVSTDIFVGLCMERSIELYVAIYGVLKAGGAYAPLDPEYPQDRLSLLIEDIECPVILTQDHLLHLVPKTHAGIQVVSLNSGWKKEISSQSVQRPHVKINPESLAYMIYTSGSTGKPKGCANTHKGITNYVQWTQEKYPMCAKDKLLHKTPFTFDVSVPEILWPLMKGASVAIAKAGGHRDSAYMVQEIRERNVSHIRFVPSMLQVLLEEDGVEKCTSLKVVIVSGEALPTQTVKRFYEQLPNARLVNLYGPTEAAVDCTYWDCEPTDAQLPSIPIGYPIPNTTSYVLDPNTRALLPVGVWGELYLGGVQLAREYWKRPDLTPDRFVHDPFSKAPGARMYKTGDRARFLENGAVEFQGRLDFQVKVRGFRIELGEVEVALLSHPDVVQTAVVLKKIHGDQGPGSLVAYWVDKKAVNPEDLRELLKKSLPEYMVPSAFIRLEAIPQTTSGKIDRKVLMTRKDDIKTESKAYSPPIDALEQTLTEAWEKVLNIKPISRDDNYFGLGGDSLGLIRILHSLKSHKLGLELKDMYAHQTIAAAADLIRKRKSGSGSKSVDLRYANIPDAWRTFIPAGAEDAYPLSGMQALMLANYGGPNSAYHFQETLCFEHTKMSSVLLAKALHMALDPHPSFRTVIVPAGAENFQAVMPKLQDATSQVDIFSQTQKVQEKTILDYGEKDRTDFFNLADHRRPLWRARFFQCAPDKVTVCLTIHHVIMDGWSLNQLFKSWQEIYQKLSQDTPVSLSARDGSYKEFVALEKQAFEEKELKQFWQKEFAPVGSIQPRASLQPIPSAQKAANKIRRQLSKETLAQLMKTAKDQNVSMKVIFLNAFYETLRARWNQDTVVMGVVTNGRSEHLSNPFGAMGLFWNFMPYFDSSKSENLKERLQVTQQRLLKLEEGSRLSLHQIASICPQVQDMNVSFNFTDFDRFAAPLSEKDQVRMKTLAAHDQFHFQLNCFVGLDATGDDSIIALNASENLLGRAELETLMDQMMERLKSALQGFKQAA